MSILQREAEAEKVNNRLKSNAYKTEIRCKCKCKMYFSMLKAFVIDNNYIYVKQYKHLPNVKIEM